ncbi:MAG: endonuclease/exonuclease/phosphatase family protein, partial [Salinivirgaceae bacterium]
NVLPREVFNKRHIRTSINIPVAVTWLHFSDYSPQPVEVLSVESKAEPVPDTLSALIWNIGYAGLGSDMDFFYDGGKKMRTSYDIAVGNFQRIQETIAAHAHVDFLLLQEVDKQSKRSYGVDQARIIDSILHPNKSFFAYNYMVPFVPVPVSNPLGAVQSGLLLSSKHTPAYAQRHGFEGNYSWPKSLVMLDRCFLVAAYPVQSGDTLFVVNTHNTAYDDGGLRTRQMAQLKKWMESKYRNGNYIVIGGDWNQLPDGISDNYFGVNPSSENYSPLPVPENFLSEGWTWVYDSLYPTNRGLDKPFTESSYTTIIDFFIVSPNIEPLQAKTSPLEFQNSDHDPVFVQFALNPSFVTRL